MISIEPAQTFKVCNACYTKAPIYNLVFRYEGTNSGTQVTLCDKCLEELSQKINGKPLPRMRGRWTSKTSLKPFGEDTVQCTECGFYTDRDGGYKFCPMCGTAKEEKIEET